MRLDNPLTFDFVAHTSTPQFMENLESITVREDLLILKDSSCFGDWRVINKNTHGIWTLSNGKNRVTIIYANRTKIENNIGVDLIYFDLTNHLYVFVQYKRSADKKWNFIYYPDSDKNPDKELRLMEKRELSLTKDKSDYRINGRFSILNFAKRNKRSTQKIFLGRVRNFV